MFRLLPLILRNLAHADRERSEALRAANGANLEAERATTLVELAAGLIALAMVVRLLAG